MDPSLTGALRKRRSSDQGEGRSGFLAGAYFDTRPDQLSTERGWLRATAIRMDDISWRQRHWASRAVSRFLFRRAASLAIGTKVSMRYLSIPNFLICQLERKRCNALKTVQGVESKSMVYKVAFLRADGEIETLYWNGSLEETIGLARNVALECAFEEFRIMESVGSGEEVFSEQLPSSKQG